METMTLSTKDETIFYGQRTKDEKASESTIEIFSNQEFGKIRTIEVDGKPYFVANDVAKALGYAKPNNAVNVHCKHTLIQGIPHPQSETKTLKVNVIPEGDVYRLVSHSELPNAEKFESWVFDEVLPSIRKRGTYMTDNLIEKLANNPDLVICIATKLKEERKRNNELQAQLDTSKDWYSIKRVAAMNGVEWKAFNWRLLKDKSIELGYGVKKIFDANYGEVNTYHREVWENVYPEYEI